jgi:hypothetical protein
MARAVVASRGCGYCAISLFSAYKMQHDRKGIEVMGLMYLRWEQLRNLLLRYRFMINAEAAEDSLEDQPTSSCHELSPPGRRISSCRHMHERTPTNDRGAQRAENRPSTADGGAKKTRGGRSRRR